MDVERHSYQSEERGDTAPPSYESLYGRLKSARGESSGVGDCFRKFMVILCGSVVGTVLIGLALAIPVTMIAIGAVYLHDCPVERYIPIYLIVGGCFGIVQLATTTSLRIKNRRDDKEEENAKPNPFSGILSCFLFAWFIAGSVWVYSIYGRVNTWDPTASSYCHPTAYWFTFVVITATYCLMALSCLCCAFCGLITYCCCSPEREE